jgi:hypothetical protein
MEKKEFSDIELLTKLYQYLDNHDITQDSAARTLGVARPTLTKWKRIITGEESEKHELSPKNRKGIKALIFNTQELNYDVDPLNKMLMDGWRGLNNEKKFKVLAYIEQLKTQTGNGIDQLGELRQSEDTKMGFRSRLKMMVQ